MSSEIVVSLKEVSCPICLDILCEPLVVPCGHTFCQSCLRSQINSVCAICQESFQPENVRPNRKLKKMIRSAQICCDNCEKVISATGLKEHEKVCVAQTVKFDPSAFGKTAPQNVSNRSTFSCPYCGSANMTVENLVSHCNHIHRHDEREVVCPVCASMPWGDSSQTSTGFIEHLNRRHKFEYDTYVDYNQDDEEMLAAALQASLEQC